MPLELAVDELSLEIALVCYFNTSTLQWKAPRWDLDLIYFSGYAVSILFFSRLPRVNQWNKNKMPHAIVFNGLKGIGKATFAYRLARFILKESAENGA